MNIIDVSFRKDEILQLKHEVFCPICNSKQFSPFDKLYTECYETCIDCEKEDLLEKRGEIIFKIL